jgi:hypothetical protein
MLRSLVHGLRRLANPAVFVVRFDGGTASLRRGKTPAAWIDDCGQLAAEFGIERGLLDGVRTWRGLELRFSPAIPAASHQRFRNVFALYRPAFG